MTGTWTTWPRRSSGPGRTAPSWSARLVRWLMVKVGPFLAVSILAAVLLHLAHVDLGWLLMAMFYTSPLMAAGVASFIAYAWRQNTGLTWSPPASQVDLATEPGQASQPRVGQARPEEPGQMARPGQPTTVTVTVLPGTTAALPQAAGQTAPIHYPIREPEEETP